MYHQHARQDSRPVKNGSGGRSQLRINAVTARNGFIQVEAADLTGHPVDGRTFAEALPQTGDLHWAPVAWAQHDTTGVESGKPVVLRFRMKLAKIYGLQFD